MAGPLILDKTLIARREARAAASPREGADYLLHRAVEELVDRLTMVERSFPLALAAHGRGPALAEALAASGKVEEIVALEQSLEAASRHRGPVFVADEERLPLAEESLTLYASVLGLHNANDLPGALIQARRALKPDGLFLAVFPGGDTLMELRQAFMQAESEVSGGVSPRVAPFADIRDVGALLQRAGFALPVVDRERVSVRYGDPLSLMADLKAMGASNALLERSRRPATRGLILRAAEAYRDLYADDEGKVPATFELFALSGWAPHESQQKPAKRGSADVSLARLLGNDTEADEG
ncbi:methyltransferase domain-containing protein [Afifella sp. IM 167]|uniref:methyltransferase domain-containing protein n=1 Tax=Afifella sp. IM 167 TaxID=2033586 RepID=UPI001CCA7183|nr:methyltransferase domain-containing protein [Afifella sp. IM 167]MBZ8133016.1 SAM-dependent methyltransferase [Afifella sp. IM 167]